MTAAPVAVERLEPAEAEARQRRVAGALARSGLGRGDRVVFSMGSSADLLCAVLGALRTGVVPVLLNATLTDGERDILVADARPSLVVSDTGSLAALVDGPEAELAPRPVSRPMHYTSGTTGRPKGVWSGLFDDDDAAALFDDEADLWGFGPDDVHLVCAPMCHSVSIRFAAGTLLRGGTVVVLERFDAPTAALALAGQAVTTTFMAPTALDLLLQHTALAPDALKSLRLLVHAGAPCPEPLKRAAIESTAPGALWEFYGSTEGQFTVCAPEDWLTHPGTVGRARPGRVIETDESGTIWCQAPPFARFSYWGDDHSTSRAWRGDAFTVGDLGRVDADGFVFLDGRRDDLIISGGVNVYPAEVEAVLAQAPGVHEVAVFAADDARWGQRVCAAVVGPAREDDLRAFAAGRLAPYKRPKTYVSLSELPRTATGKLVRRALSDTAAGTQGG